MGVRGRGGGERPPPVAGGDDVLCPLEPLARETEVVIFRYSFPGVWGREPPRCDLRESGARERSDRGRFCCGGLVFVAGGRATPPDENLSSKV